MATEQRGCFTVGTSETGSFMRFSDERQAILEAQDWAKSEPGVTVLVWAANDDGEAVDVIYTFTEREQLPFVPAEQTAEARQAVNQRMYDYYFG